MLSKMRVLICDNHDKAVNDAVYAYACKVNVEFAVTKLPKDQPSTCHQLINDTVNVGLRHGDHLAVYDIHSVAKTYQQAITFCDALVQKGVTFHVVRHELAIKPCDYTSKVLDVLDYLYRTYVTNSLPQVGRPKGRQNKSHRLDQYRHEILEYVEQGLSRSAIAQKIDCHRQTLSAWLVRNDVYVRTRLKLDGHEQEIMACFRRDMSLTKVAEKFNVSRDTLRYWLKCRGLYERVNR